ncbi:MAG: hypothetical protein LBQ24_02260 [Candidatus Peribacteria bacterium]|nr:hypothetical protein [Candidatus Peribacteria bacterium]
MNEKVRINLNIVISKINIFSTYKYLNFLLKTKTIKILTLTEYTIDNRKIPKISFGLIQPN